MHVEEPLGASIPRRELKYRSQSQVSKPKDLNIEHPFTPARRNETLYVLAGFTQVFARCHNHKLPYATSNVQNTEWLLSRTEDGISERVAALGLLESTPSVLSKVVEVFI